MKISRNRVHDLIFLVTFLFLTTNTALYILLAVLAFFSTHRGNLCPVLKEEKTAEVGLMKVTFDVKIEQSKSSQGANNKS